MSFQLESIDSGSNYNFADKMLYSNPPRSVFDLSHLCTLTISNAGLVVPLGMPIETVPGDDFDISVDALIRVMPQVVPLYSRQRLYVYAFWSPYESLMCDWNVFARKGYTGNETFDLPSLSKALNMNEGSSDGLRPYVLPDGWLDYIGVPVGAYLGQDSSGNHPLSDLLTKPLLWAMQSLRIKRDYFLNRDYFIENRVIFPDDDSRFRLNRDGELLSMLDLRPELKGLNKLKITCNYPNAADITWSITNYNSWISGTVSEYYFHALFHHDYPSDYFLSAKPWPQRGEAPTLDGTSSGAFDLSFRVPGSAVQWRVDGTSPDSIRRYFDAYAEGTQTRYRVSDSPLTYAYRYELPLSPFTNSNGVTPQSTEGVSTPVSAQLFTSANDVTASATLNNFSFATTLNNIRELAIAQTELERMARTDGSYTGFALTFFGERPRLDVDYRPIYIGGTYKNLVFNEVLQTSGSSVGTTDPTTSSPLGAYSGHGIGGIQNGHIGHIHCDDYGSIMILACIMPDVYYHQGIPKEMTMKEQSELYLPDRARLGMIPIFNRELYWQNDDSSQPEKLKNDYLWAYQDPFDEMRYRPNTIHGKIADPTNKSFFPYTQARHFSTLPTYGDGFAETVGIRKDYLYATSEDAYSAQFKLNIRAVRPLPYKAMPAEILN